MVVVVVNEDVVVVVVVVVVVDVCQRVIFCLRVLCRRSVVVVIVLVVDGKLVRLIMGKVNSGNG